jgi:hypothetical protein
MFLSVIAFGFSSVACRREGVGQDPDRKIALGVDIKKMGGGGITYSVGDDDEPSRPVADQL